MASPTTQATSPPADRPTNAPDAVIAPPPDDGVVEADEDSAYATSTYGSEWTSVTSSIYRGIIENGRRYQALKEGEYWGPSDEQQFECQANNHLCHLLYDQFEGNPYFRAPIGEGHVEILDVGCGEGQWAVDVADRYPAATVRGVDLHPPPQTWVPPNCVLEVDDATKPWTWSAKFDLVHLHWMVGSFSDEGWRAVYKEAYKNLKPGGWIEQVEPDILFKADDGTVHPDSAMAKWGPLLLEAGEKMGHKLNTLDMMRGLIEEAGFVSTQEKVIRFPHGSWAKHPLLKEVGKIHMKACKIGLEGYAMFLLTRFGNPPWSPEAVQMMLMQMRQELDSRSHHSYTTVRRVWAQKPFE